MLNHFFSKKISGFSAWFLLAASVTLLAGCGGGGSGTTASTTPPATSFSLLADPPTVNSDGLNSTTITIVALNAANATVSGVVATLSADSGILSDPTITTGTGAAPVTVTFSPGASKINRTATITATAGTISAQIPVQIIGSTVVLSSSGSTLPDDGQSPVTLTITAKDSGGNVVPNAAVTLNQTGSGRVTITPTSGTTDVNGQLSAQVKGVGAGAATIRVEALGAVATTDLTVSPTAATFAIDRLNGVDALNTTLTAMKIGETLSVRVNTLTATEVTFATTLGEWDGGAGSVVKVVPVGGKATANLVTAKAGLATVQVYDSFGNAMKFSDSLTVAMSSATPASITVQPSPSVVSKSVGSTTGSSTLIAMVRDVNGFPVGDAPVSFSIVNPTGGGESVSPAVVLTAATISGGLNLGEARASFTSGSASSGANGVQIRASVVGTNVATEPFDPITLLPVNLTSSGSDATVIIGGTSGSVAFGIATSIATDSTNSNYVQDMSVMVTDSNGNPAPVGTVVNLSVWPLTFSTGTNCARDADSLATPAIAAVPAVPATVAVPAVAAVAGVAAKANLGNLSISAKSTGTDTNNYLVTLEVNNALNAVATVTSATYTGITVQFDGDSNPSTWAQVANAINASAASRVTATTPAGGGVTVTAADVSNAILTGGVNAVAAVAAIPAQAEIPAQGAIPASPARGTFYNEDINENLILDAGEDGKRDWYDPGFATQQGTSDGYATPPSSAAGSVPSAVYTDTPAGGTLPATVTTDASGVAAFKLTYPKKSAIWITDRIRARTVVQGTEMVGEIILYLSPTKPDASPICYLPDSPYSF